MTKPHETTEPNEPIHEKSTTQSTTREPVTGEPPDLTVPEPVLERFGLLFVDVRRVRARFAATLFPPNRRAWVSALAASARDVPLLLFELTRLRTAYADLVAACRAGLLARRDGEPEAAVWRYIEDELPPAPLGHPLHNPDIHNPATDGQGARPTWTRDSRKPEPVRRSWWWYWRSGWSRESGWPWDGDAYQ